MTEDKTGISNAPSVASTDNSKGDEEFLISTHQHGNSVQVEVRGDVDLFTAHHLSKALEDANSRLSKSQSGHERPEDVRNILVDLSQVGFIDSAGLAVLIQLRRQLEPACQMTLVIEPGSQPARVIRLSRFDTFFPIVNSRDASISLSPNSHTMND